jgi:transcriptional regulator with XRE-family HTH domain
MVAYGVRMGTKTAATVTESAAEIISDAMRDAGKSALAMSEETGIARSTLTRRLLNGSGLEVEELHAIGKVLGIPASVLLARAESNLLRTVAA